MFKKQFELLERAVGRIQQQLQTADADQKLYLAEELFALRNVCDSFLEKWIDFDEHCSDIIETYQLDQFASTTAAEVSDSSTSEWNQFLTKHMSTPIPKGSIAKFHEPLETSLHVRSFQKGVGFFQLLMYPEAIREFEHAVAQNQDHSTIARMYLAVACVMQGRREEARRHLKLLQHVANEPLVLATVYQAKGVLEAQERQYGDAIRHFSRAQEIMPELKDLSFNLGVCHFKTGKYVQALQQFMQAFRSNLEDLEAGELCAKLWRFLGYADEGKGYALQLVQRQPERSDFVCLLAELELELGNYEEAIKSYQKALSFDPACGRAYSGLGWIALWRGNTDKARAFVQKHLSIQPKSKEGLFYFGWLLIQQGELQKAQKVFETLLRYHAAEPYGLIGLSHIYGELGEASAARDLLHRVVRNKDPNIKRIALVHLGRIAMAQKQYEQSMRYLNAALGFDSHAVETLFYKGLNHYFMGDHERAQEYWSKCGELQPQSI
ncbi:tetratricopeptide repeat protein [Fodinisporobacter ferrooxydans]|uniref:Tetratricopeptide repeat protein n=1 Tax=Fodinisporobacter ferrooxydans TaxID=2901836 RepID=A0ABY4CGT1_9BACL|nr:tetratricopeptide repeat protein [Alicyclobacillaceae bacterium MYW30-H2]